MGADWNAVEHDRQLVAGARAEPVEALGRQLVLAPLAGAAEADDDRPAALLVELHVGAVAGEDLTGPAWRPDEARATVEHRQHFGLGRRSAGMVVGGGDPGVVVGVAASVVAEVEPSVVSGNGLRRRCRRRAQAGGSSGGRRRRRHEPAPSVVLVDPSCVVESLGVDVVGALVGGEALEDGLQRHDPGHVSGVQRLALVAHAGRSTTMSEPSTRTSGSAIPRFSSSERTRSRTTTRSSSVAPSVGVRTTDTALQVESEDWCVAEAEVEGEATTATPTMTSDVQSRRRFIPAASRVGVSAELSSSVAGGAADFGESSGRTSMPEPLVSACPGSPPG